ncbi:MAG TPA: c-type cytochrome [Oxalicibacterium sp.]|jgi:cytochrome c5|nr:c-type cytochrome [Oxalicibacterium sp.]
MSDAHHQQSGIKTPKQLILAVIAGFLVPIICIVLLVEYVTNERREGAGSDTSPQAVAERLQPVADVGFTLKDVNAPKVYKSGDEVYKSTCAACHASGAAGAPKFGDAGDWKARIAQGYDTLAKHALHGLRAMPPKGGNADLDDVEVERAVVLMANAAGAKFAEPAAPAPAAAGSTANAAASGTAPTK